MKIKNIFIHIILIIVCILSLLPFLWLLSTALKGQQENIYAYPPIFIPQDFTFDNIIQVLKVVPIVKYCINSFIVAGFTVILNVILSAMHIWSIGQINHLSRTVPDTIKGYAPGELIFVSRPHDPA